MPGATTMPSPYMPMAAPSFSLGTMRKRMVMQVTGRTPPGIACRIRNAISPPSPEDRAHSRDEIVKSTINAM